LELEAPLIEDSFDIKMAMSGQHQSLAILNPVSIDRSENCGEEKKKA
jgi:hypothetical protein